MPRRRASSAPNAPGGIMRWSRRCGMPAASTWNRASGPPPVVDADEVGAANMILTNGARPVCRSRAPEYSPEVTDPLDAVILGQGRRAGDGGRRPPRRERPGAAAW